MKQQPTTTRDTGKPETTVVQPARRGGGIRRYALIMATLLVASISFNVLAVSRLPGITPIDGPAYLDAYTRALDGAAARRGQTFDGPTLDAIACRGLYGIRLVAPLFGPKPMMCDSQGQAVDDAVRAKWDAAPSTAYVHPPTYFFLTAWSVRAIEAVLPGDQDGIDLARVLGAVWFSLGALLLVRAAALWGANPWAAAAVLLAFLPTPTFVSLFTFVTPDSMSLLVGAGVVLAVTLWWHRRMPAWPLLLVGLATAAVAGTFLLAAGAGGLVLAALWWFQRGRDLGATAGAAAWLLGGAAAGAIGWTVLRELIAIGPPIPLPAGGGVPAQDASVDNLLGLLVIPGATIPAEAAGAAIRMPGALAAVAAALALLTAAAAFGAVLYRRDRNPAFALAAGGVTAFALGGFLVATLSLVADGLLPPAAPRYAFGAWPFYILPLLLIAHRRLIAATVGTLLVIGPAAWLWLA